MLNKIKNFFIKLKPSKRKLIQVYAALLTNANLAGFVTGNIYTGNTKYACVPGMNCYSCPGAIGACPLGSIQNALASSKTTGVQYVFGIILLYCILFGRTICGYLCPAGLLQELLYKIKTPKLQKNRVTRILSYTKYVLLLVLVIAIPLIYGHQDNVLAVPAFCKYICPVGTFEGAIGLLANPSRSSLFSTLGYLFTWKFVILALIVVGSIFIYRIFCRFLCPLGALYGLFNKLAIIGIKVDKSKCDHCNACISKCKMDIKYVGDHECINCGECIVTCHTNAISWKLIREKINEEISEENIETIEVSEPISIGEEVKMNSEVKINNESINDNEATIDEINIDNKKSKSIFSALKGLNKRLVINISVSVVALGVLFGAIIYYGFNQTERNVIGIGLPCPTQEIEVYGSDDSFNVIDYEGKVVIINFWATWCGPCVAELPHFNEVQEMYMDDVVIIAIDQAGDKETAISNCLENPSRNWKDYSIKFGFDEVGNEYYNVLGGSGSWPMSIIVDQEGRVSQIHDSAISKEQLIEIIEGLIG